MGDTIETVIVKQQTLSAEEYSKLTDSQRSNIKRTQILPPKLGRTGFGSIFVEYKNPLLKKIG